MTNKEALIAVLEVDVSDNTLEKSLIDNALNGSSTYTLDNAEAIDRCAIPILQVLLSQANISEGGYSKSFDRAAVQSRLKILATKYGIEEILNQNAPRVTAKSPW